MKMCQMTKLWRMQAHVVRRKRKAHRKRMAAARAGYGLRGMRSPAQRRDSKQRISTLQKPKAMTQENKNKWSVIINVILTSLTAILSAFGLA